MRDVKIADSRENVILRFFQLIGAGVRRFWAAGRKRFTIMLVPHSENRTIHFQISVFSLFFVLLMFLGLLSGFLWFSLDFSGNSIQLASRSRDLEDTEASLEIMRDEVNDLIRSSGAFEDALQKTLTSLGDTSSDEAFFADSTGDLSSLFNALERDENPISEVNEIQRIKNMMNNSVDSLNQIEDLLVSIQDLMGNFPTLWPLKGVRGTVTAVFGPSIHPIYGSWYLHKGIDLAASGTIPILATANGKVEKVDYDKNGYGYYLVVRHQYGFGTKYAHLRTWPIVKVGDVVTQGQVIGYMGTSGMSTGQHLHYEVMVGTQVENPVLFLNMSGNAGVYDNINRDLRRYK